MPTRNAQATWNGNLKEGQGSMKLGSGAFEGKYSFGTRFESAPGFYAVATSKPIAKLVDTVPS